MYKLSTQKDILSFWKDIEVFSLPDLPSNAKELDLNKPLPWQLPFTPQANSTWRHIVFLGKHGKSKIIDVIDNALGDTSEKPDWLEKPTGNTCMAVLILNEAGRLSGDNPYLQASYLYGIKCLQDSRKISEVIRYLNEVQEKFRERHPYQETDTLENLSTPLITAAHLKKEIAVLNDLNIKEISCGHQVYVQSIQVSKQSKADTGFLNSFYLDDLNRLSDNSTKFGEGLSNYLRAEINQKMRVDFLKDADAFFEVLDPLKLPAGRWPSNPTYGLYSAQVGAVNSSLLLLKDNGIIGINGPPGTGKTTLLSDIIAEVVVLRAKKLMQENVSALFSKGNRIEKENRSAYHFPVNSNVFDDAGIVVASNNNAAVENISKELPDERKIDRDTFPDAGYFDDYAQSLIEGKSWGLLAAALGNSENRTIFKNNFWYKNGDNPGFAAFLQSLYNNPENEDRTPNYLDGYRKTKTELETLLKEFEGFKKAASDFHQLLPGFLNDQKNKIGIENHINQLLNLIKSLNNHKQPLIAQLTGLETQISEIQYSIQLHQSVKPGFFFFHKLFNTTVFKKWNEPYHLFVTKHNDLARKRIEVQKEAENFNIEITVKEKERTQSQDQLNKINQRINIYNKERENLHDKYGIAYRNIPDENLLISFQHDKDVFHKSNPWSSVSINKLRSEIFIKSLQLHEYAILRNAKQFKNNIGLLMEVMDGKVDVAQDIALSLWQSFFFCIPVVSTSLASVSRLFGSLGKENIGWLLLDEAGQATPQSAAGIIYRSKRSIIIGDPLQIEPVVTAPAKLINVLNGQYRTDSIWSPLRSSAQILADRITASGTWMKQTDNDENIWTGFPLRTHRRCNNPMFDISNEIAYNFQMVKAMNDIPFDCALGSSVWFDVNGSNIQNKQVVEEELSLLKEKIQLLGKTPRKVFVISPFKSVADRCKQDLYVVNSKIQCGTIHTFQGKEADIVFLVLGSDPNKPGSRQWASQKPNMLNVALTRAKKRFYVIGSKKLWRSYPFFSTLAQKL
ncbi:ATP-binding protein [Mucilaginibacter rubeus]|nr:ATP-binding protein [Mucilaginibacter rubeus]